MNIRALNRSPKGVKKDGNWFWFLDKIILLLCWVVNHLYQFGQVCPAAPQWWQICCFFYLGFWVFPFLGLGFLISFLSSLGSSPKIDLPLSMLSLANTVFTLLFSDSTLLAGETKTVVLVEAILKEEKSYLKLIQSEADFWILSISSNFALKVLSNWVLTWNSFA